jgi:hypothetical protein
MQTTASSQNKSRTATRESESANKPRGIKRQMSESSIKPAHDTKRMRKK